METSYIIEKFEISKADIERGVTFLRMNKLKAISSYKNEDILMCDFKQGNLENCGLISVLAALSQRTEFLSEIAPTIVRNRNTSKYQFKMFHQGRPIKVLVDDALPFDKNNGLVYASSKRNDTFYLASYFEKAFIKKACNNSYELSRGADIVFVFSSFSECMISYLEKSCEHNCTKNLTEFIKSEFDNKSSLVIGISPALEVNVNCKGICGHAYTIIEYNQEHNALKLYDPDFEQEHCVSNESLSELDADKKKGEFWVSIDQFEKRGVDVASLHSKAMYKPIHKINISSTEKNKRNASCKVIVTEPTTIMINFFSYTYAVDKIDLKVTAGEFNGEEIKLNYKLPNCFTAPDKDDKRMGVEKAFYNQKFELQPNSYIFHFECLVLDEGRELGKGNFLIKIGSTSPCTFDDKTV